MNRGNLWNGLETCANLKGWAGLFGWTNEEVLKVFSAWKAASFIYSPCWEPCAAGWTVGALDEQKCGFYRRTFERTIKVWVSFYWDCAASASESGNKDTTVSTFVLRPAASWNLPIFLTSVCFKMKCYNNSGLKLKPTKTSPQLIEKKKSFAFLRLALTGPKLFSAPSMCCLPVFLPDVQKR